MKSIEKLYVYGPGPSSSHTIGPHKAALAFKDLLNLNNIKFDKIIVTLYGSLALTGKGHLTDAIILNDLKEYDVEVVFNAKKTNLKHPNTLCFTAYFNNEAVKSQTYYSVGGGTIVTSLTKASEEKEVYPFKDFNEIKEYLIKNNIESLDKFVDYFEPDVNSYLKQVLEQMFNSVEDGLKNTGVLPGNLKLKRVAGEIYNESKVSKDVYEKTVLELSAYAYSVSEENASGRYIITAPTCGSSGVLPAVLYYYSKHCNVDNDTLINALKVAAVFGNLIKQNASISGAVLGCQAEIGTACVMGAAAFSYINGLSVYQTEYACEVAMEHCLGLTCDPVQGYVQIPCIERNGVAVMRSYDAYIYAKNISILRKNRVSFDKVVEAMKNTGEIIDKSLRETSLGGLAKVIK